MLEVRSFHAVDCLLNMCAFLFLSQTGENCLRWLTCAPFKTTNGQKDVPNADSRLSKEKAMLAESFRIHQRTEQVEPYDPSEVLVAWDWDTEDER